MQADTSICEHDKGSAQGDALCDPQDGPQLTRVDLLLLHLHQHTYKGRVIGVFSMVGGSGCPTEQWGKAKFNMMCMYSK